MKRSWALGIVLLIAGCGPHYTIPNYESNEIEKVISSGRSPEGCIENLKEDAQKLNVKVRLTDVQQQASFGADFLDLFKQLHVHGQSGDE